MPKVMAYVWFLTKEQSQIDFDEGRNPEFGIPSQKGRGHILKLGALPPNPRDLALW
jgi:hypothetical protein